MGWGVQGETGERAAAAPAQPLSGMTVVEMTLAVQGPAVGVYLRDMGAEVIKVEPPLGDPSRYGRNRDNTLPEGTPGPQFVAVNRGKRSVCMDVGTELGARALRTLLEQADVFFSNYRTAALEELGLGFAAVHELNPTLIYAHVNGFGPQGPDADKAMLDGAAVARGGLLHHTGSADETPSLPGAIIGDTSGAMHLALGIVTALLARERGHGGQRVQTSALGTQMWLQQWEVTHVGMTGATLERSHSHHPNIRGPYGVYATSDGGAIMLAHTMQQEAWDAVCAYAECPELAIDPRFQAPGQRLGEGLTDEDSAEVRAALTRGFKLHTAEEWDAYLRTQPEAIWERVRDYHQVLNDPQNIANGYITEVEVPGVGSRRTVGNLVHLSKTPGSVKGGPPLLGEGNNEILARCHLNPGEIAEVTAHADHSREVALAELLAAAETNPANGEAE